MEQEDAPIRAKCIGSDWQSEFNGGTFSENLTEMGHDEMRRLLFGYTLIESESEGVRNTC